MSERFADLKKIPKQPAARLLALGNARLQSRLKSPASASVADVLIELAAADALVDSGIAERFALRGLALEPETARPEVATLQQLLSRIRRNYGDPAPFEHPWRAGDLVPYVFHTVVNGRFVYGAEFTG